METNEPKATWLKDVKLQRLQAWNRSLSQKVELKAVKQKILQKAWELVRKYIRRFFHRRSFREEDEFAEPQPWPWAREELKLGPTAFSSKKKKALSSEFLCKTCWCLSIGESISLNHNHLVIPNC